MTTPDTDIVHATVWRPNIDGTPYDWQYMVWTQCHPDCPACAEKQQANDEGKGW